MIISKIKALTFPRVPTLKTLRFVAGTGSGSIALLLLVGCGVEASEPVAGYLPETSSSIEVDDAIIDDYEESEPIEDWNLNVEVGPLDEYLVRLGRSTIGLSTEEAARSYSARRLLEEDYIAACMAEYGFEYIPGIWVDHGSTDFNWDALSAPFGSREFAETYGFGVAVDWTAIRQPLVDITGPNPNEEIFDQLSPAEQSAYIDTLRGTCASRAWEAVIFGDTDEFDGIRQELDFFPSSVNNDPRVSALDRDWSTCMANFGYSGFEAPGVFLLRQLWAEWEPDADQEAFADWERAVAVADWDCQDQLDYEFARRRINVELQHRFVTLHIAELEAWVLHAEGRLSR